jgi:hypothetical protein
MCSKSMPKEKMYIINQAIKKIVNKLDWSLNMVGYLFKNSPASPSPLPILILSTIFEFFKNYKL